MNLFLLLSVPLAALASRRLYLSRGEGRAHGSAFIKGGLSFIPGSILLSIYHGIFRPDFAGFGLVMYDLGEGVLTCGAIFLGYALFYPLGREGTSTRFRDLFLLTAGYLSLAALDQAFWGIPERDFFYLFLSPIFRLGLLFLVPYCLSEAIDETGPRMVLWALALIPACFMSGLAEFLFTRSLVLPLILCLLAYGGAVAFLMLKKLRD